MAGEAVQASSYGLGTPEVALLRCLFRKPLHGWEKFVGVGFELCQSGDDLCRQNDILFPVTGGPVMPLVLGFLQCPGTIR